MSLSCLSWNAPTPLQKLGRRCTVREPLWDCIDSARRRQHHAPVRVLPNITKLDECFGDFLVRVTSPCGASRHIEPEALARMAGPSVTLATLAQRMRCSQCGRKIAEVVAVARPRPRGGGRRE